MTNLLYDKALDAIKELYGDTSVFRTETLELMEALQEEIEDRIRALKVLQDPHCAS